MADRSCPDLDVGAAGVGAAAGVAAGAVGTAAGGLTAVGAAVAGVGTVDQSNIRGGGIWYGYCHC